MVDDKVPALVTVLGGKFGSQAEAFETFRTACETAGVEFVLEDIDVIREAREVRMAHYFRPAIVARIEQAQGDDDTVILIFPSALTAEPRFPPPECGLRLLGRFAGRVKTRPL